ncbi:sterol desaturase family protein [Pigmentibacter sp. JX0631]|uniref:sterol desaturase family protein n=1 Tax=Pigmentibacter sp. JX0631 TaxID=2976982 RepID=UPI002468C82C|nr:sterol desaturase family protein [Pigmentibacter sp. JX0631]WGL59480.1 sterol desaturase family protein [Pigmentibacter sp. JX0631]
MKLFMFFTIPIYLIAIILEFFYFKKQHKIAYKVKDTFASLVMGLGYLIVSSLAGIYIFYIYSFVYEFKLFDIPSPWMSFFLDGKINLLSILILFILDDFCYYWFHRISHICRFFWCAHETHHSSEYYNFGTALRQSWIGAPFTWIFWLPLPLIGFRPEDIFFQATLNLFYQFWIHTKLTKSFGFLDYIFNTPSHHRVHHGTEIPYLDKNYGGIFIIWDRIFKTFTPEKKEPKYGVLHPVNSFNPFKIAFHMIYSLIIDIKNEKKLLNKIKFLFYPPGWLPNDKGLTTKQMQDNYKNNNLL